MQVFDFLWAPAVLLLITNCNAGPSRLESYKSQREAFFRNEQNMAFGANVTLNSAEIRANRTIMDAKIQEFNEAFDKHHLFIPSRPISETLAKIKESILFQLLSKMPKGAVLNAKDRAMCSIDCIMRITYLPNLIICSHSDGKIKSLTFSKKQPRSGRNITCAHLVELRKDQSKKIDDSLRQQLTLDLTDISFDRIEVWNKFNKLYSIVDRLLLYAPAWKEYFYRSLEEFHADGVQYVEFRSALPNLFDFDGNKYTAVDFIRICKEILNEFMQKYPDFIGCKVIYAPSRAVDTNELEQYNKTHSEIKMKYPDFVAGFDLSGPEDISPTLKEFTRELVGMPDSTDFLLHAGGTNWAGTIIDENLIDAVQLKSHRISNAFALLKHPLVMKYVKENNIAVEVLPISNQAFGYIFDLRNHPCSHLFADNYPVVVSSDYPTFWNVKPLSHDFFIAFYGIASFHSDLKLLKKLAENSINYSSLKETEKADAIQKWEAKWNIFIASL